MIVVKSAKRTLIDTVRPAAAARTRRAVLSGEAQEFAVDGAFRVVHVHGEGLVGADAALAMDRFDAARVAAPGEVVEVGTGRVAEARRRVASGVWRDVGDGGQTEAGEMLLGFSPPQERTDGVAGRR